MSTSQRAREFGVRVALGATRHDIVRRVLGEGLTLAGFGVIAGVVVALPLTQLLRSLPFGVTATDPVTFVFVSVALVLVAAAACLCRRAARSASTLWKCCGPTEAARGV